MFKVQERNNSMTNPIEEMEAALRVIAGYERGQLSEKDFSQMPCGCARSRAQEALRKWEAVKEQYVLVPKEPTNKMIDAGIAQFRACDNGIEYGYEQIYKAMIAVADNNYQTPIILIEQGERNERHRNDD